MDSVVGQLATVEDRRRALRQHAAALDIVSARVRPGHEAFVLNVSFEGALIESACRLWPGSWVDLRLDTTRHLRFHLRANIVRSIVSRLSPVRVWYRAGIRFDRIVDFAAAASDAQNRNVQGRTFSDVWGPATHDDDAALQKSDEGVSKR